jgi:hypothetical protein
MTKQMIKQISLLKQYALLVEKGLNNWKENDFSESRKIYAELCNYFGENKTQQALKETRLHIIKQIYNKEQNK